MIEFTPDNLVWRKSSRSTADSACVEVASTPQHTIAVRDSKDPHGPVLTFIPSEWTAFLGGVKGGEFDD